MMQIIKMKFTKITTVTVQPQLTRKPVILSSERSINITWPEWDLSEGDTGDGPAVGYRLYWRKKTAKGWTELNKTTTVELFHSVLGLEPYTSYEAAVAVYRPGTAGLGQRTPIADITTKCTGILYAQVVR